MIACTTMGQPQQTKAECCGYMAGLQDALGEPPVGSYFWPCHDQGARCWKLQFCFDDKIEAHFHYATQIATHGE